MASSSILFITTLSVIFSNIDWAFSHDREALAVITNASTPSRMDLPYSAREQNGKIIYLEKTKDGNEIEYSFLCPPQTPELVQHVKQASMDYPELAFCLEENVSNEQHLECPEEVKPVLNKRRDQDGFEKQCGKSNTEVIYDFGFRIIKLNNDVGSLTNIPPTRKLTMLSLYDVCFNSWNSQTLWTKHQVKTASMLQEPGLPSQKMLPPYEFSTEHYGLSKNTFLSIATDYRENQESDSPHKMIPQMMVPQEDLALKIWKKTTTHFVNTGELWDNLVPLMKAINDGIRKAVIEANSTTNESNINQNETVYIYTLVYSYTYRRYLDDLVDSTGHLRNNRFGLNVWCKFIHNETKNTGVMIFLHNLPDAPPKQTNSASENKECKTPIPCDFQKWSDDPAGLSNDLVDYAYCCEVNNDKVVEFFNITLDNKLGLFDIDSFINKKIKK